MAEKKLFKSNHLNLVIALIAVAFLLYVNVRLYDFLRCAIIGDMKNKRLTEAFKQAEKVIGTDKVIELYKHGLCCIFSEDMLKLRYLNRIDISEGEKKCLKT